MIRDCGFEIVKEIATVMPIDMALSMTASNPLMRFSTFLLRSATRVMPNLLGYQWLFVLRKRGEGS
jgi:hypothetical protein